MVPIASRSTSSFLCRYFRVVSIADGNQPAPTAHFILLLLSNVRTKKDRNCLYGQLRSSWSCRILVFLVGYADWFRGRLRPSLLSVHPSMLRPTMLRPEIHPHCTAMREPCKLALAAREGLKRAGNLPPSTSRL